MLQRAARNVDKPPALPQARPSLPASLSCPLTSCVPSSPAYLGAVQLNSEGEREVAAERRELESREEAVRDTGREVGLSLDQGRSVLGRERDKLRDEAEYLARVRYA